MTARAAPRMRRLLPRLLTAFVALALSLISSGGLADPPGALATLSHYSSQPVVQVAYLKGSLRVTVPGHRAKAGRSQQLLYARAALRSGSGTLASLIYEDQTALQIAGGTNLTLSSSSLIKLKAGQIFQAISLG